MNVAEYKPLRHLRKCLYSYAGKAGNLMVSYSPNVVTLCLDFYDSERQSGRLYHQYTPGAVSFTSLFQALDRMERLYDELQHPQAALRIRSFQIERRKKRRTEEKEEALALPEHMGKEMKVMEEFEKVTEQRGRDSTFIIHVKYRQNASWQGEVTWVDKQKKEHFRSALELVRLIDSAVGEADK